MHLRIEIATASEAAKRLFWLWVLMGDNAKVVNVEAIIAVTTMAMITSIICAIPAIRR